MGDLLSNKSARKRAAIASAAVLAILLVCSTALRTWGCAASAALPQSDSLHVALASQRWHGTTAEELEKGRAAYRDRCSGCHSLYAPADYTEKEWDKLLPVMQRRARTAQDERVWMEKYLRIHAKK